MLVPSQPTDKTLNGAGSSSNAHEYNWLDKDVKAGESWYYRLSDMAYNGEITRHSVLYVVVKSTDTDLKPQDFTLLPAHPNPFNPSTMISWELGSANTVVLTIYDVNGRLVRDLVNSHQSEGYHEAIWDGQDIYGNAVPAGMYLYRISSAMQTQTQKMLLLK